MAGEIGSGGYNEVRSNRKQGAMEPETNREQTGNELRLNRKRGRIKDFGASMGMAMGTASAADVGVKPEGGRRPVLAHLEKSRFLGYRLGMT